MSRFPFVYFVPFVFELFSDKYESQKTSEA